MKKLFLLCGLLVSSLASQAQADSEIFTHFGVSAGVGSTGVTIDLATGITPYVGLRAGVDWMPKLKYATTISISSVSERQQQYDQVRTGYPALNLPAVTFPGKVDVEGKLNNTTGHVLFDLYPGKTTAFHLTLGAYFGPSEVVSVYTTNDDQLKGVRTYNDSKARETSNFPKIGVELGDFFLEPDKDGHIDACIKTSSFRPYVGLGFGRAIPRKNSLGFSVDLGAQFWGTPKVYCQDEELTESDLEGNDGGAMKILTKLICYPTLTFRLTGKIF